MPNAINGSPHSFHIPVMGTGFSIDAPIKVAKFGINSVISLVDDILIEQMRKYYCEKIGEPYIEISKHDDDTRARRITQYLNLVQRLVEIEFERLLSSSFEAGSEIAKYFEMLPDGELKSMYERMLSIQDTGEKALLQEELRKSIKPGSIDVNIMTKLDRLGPKGNEDIPHKYSDASAALRGFALSNLRSSIVFSAGLNPRLFSTLNQFGDFFPDEHGELKKKIVLKVSDFRSAHTQGRVLAKNGFWVSEYRIESGLNCGGHVFPTKGMLLGTILEEFKTRKAELLEKMQSMYMKALDKLGRNSQKISHKTIFTVQGGIGTAAENTFLLEHYDMDGTGWGTPFLLVPEIINVDDLHLKKLADAGDDEVLLSDASPLGIPFWILRNSASEEAKKKLVAEENPGSACPKGFLISNTEFTEHQICRAAKSYMKKKLPELSTLSPNEEQKAFTRKKILEKACICHDLSGSAQLKLGIDLEATPTICCGPNIVNFSKISTLEEMINHIYGRISLLKNPKRPHMFIKELSLYIDHLRKELEAWRIELSDYTPKRFNTFRDNLLEGIEYYQKLGAEYIEEQKTRFLEDLSAMKQEVEELIANSFLELGIESEPITI